MLPSARSLEGKDVPHVTFKTRAKNEWKDVTTDVVFKGRNVVVFCLPGAYTPTCSSSHLPRYNELAGVFKANGVDEIVCLSVNDAFVMNEWKQDQDRYSEISLGKHITSSTLRAVSGSGTWPQVFIGGKLIGSADDLEAYFGARKAA